MIAGIISLNAIVVILMIQVLLQSDVSAIKIRHTQYLHSYQDRKSVV